MPESASNAAPAFHAEKLSFAYSREAQALSGISFRIARGEMTGIIGPNGAGKSTLLKLMAGLLEPAAGAARLEGAEVGGLAPEARARKVAFVPQAARIAFPYTVAEIVEMGRRPYLGAFAAAGVEDRARVAEAMEATGVAALAGRLFSELSGGEAQRVILARALAQGTPAILLDEPTSSLDLYYQSALYGVLERMNRERGLTVVSVTHDINLAAEYCPRLIAMREGRILFDGPPAEILTAERIEAIYGVRAEVILSGDSRLVRARHFEGRAGAARGEEGGR